MDASAMGWLDNPADQLHEFIFHDVLGVGLIIGGLLGLIFAPGILGRVMLGIAPIVVGALLFTKVIG